MSRGGADCLWLEGQNPTPDKQGQKQEKRQALEYKGMTEVGQRLVSQDMASYEPAEQAEEMGPQIGVFSRAPECSQKRRPGHDGDEEMGAGKIFSGFVAQGGQHANDCKDRRGKPDELMLRAMNKDVDKIGESGGEE